jgi:hypothetical protein
VAARSWLQTYLDRGGRGRGDLTRGVDGVKIDTIMARVETILDEMRSNPKGVRFADACKVATHFFGEPRQRGTSHCVWKMPWPGDPRVNLQRSKDGNAKSYQVRQLLSAIERLKDQKRK